MSGLDSESTPKDQTSMGNNHRGRMPEKTLGRRGYKRKLTNVNARLADKTTQLNETAEQLLEQQTLTDVANQRANTDAKTELPNENALGEILDRYINQTIRSGRKFALIETDLSGLKWTNDNLGDAQGDKLIKDTALILEESIRKSIDIVVRGHGDTFYVILDGADEQQIETFFGRVNPQFTNGNPALKVGGGIGIGIGGTVVTIDKFPNPELLRGESLVRQEQIYKSFRHQLTNASNTAMLKAKGPIDRRGLPPDPTYNALAILELPMVTIPAADSN